MPLNTPVQDWRGKTVWMVGASTGIGRATAALLHARGARVIVSARNQGALDAFVAEHPGAIGVPLDATDRDAVTLAATQVLALGTRDGMGYCAGHYHAMRADTMDVPDMERHLRINYVGALYLLDAVLPHMLRTTQGGAFVSLVGSVAGYRGLPKALAYGPGKAALIHFAECLHLDLAPQGIGVWVINPGFVATPLTAKNDFAMPALLTPEQAALATVDGLKTGKFEIHFPKRFTRVMKLLALLPYGWYFPLVRRLTGG